MLSPDHVAHLAHHRHGIAIAVAIGTSLFVSVVVAMLLAFRGGKNTDG